MTYERWHTTTYIGVVANFQNNLDNMKQGVKRPFRIYIIHGLWIILTFYYSTTNSSELGQWILRLLVVIGLISFISTIINKYYLEVVDNKLVLHKDFFRTQTVDLDKIVRFILEPDPFTSSKIVLKDNSVVKYMDSQTDNKELKELLKRFNIPIQ